MFHGKIVSVRMVITVNCSSRQQITPLTMISPPDSPFFLHLRQPIDLLAPLTSCCRFYLYQTSKWFSPSYIFRHHDITFKNSSINNIKGYMPQNHDHEKNGRGDWINVQW